MKTKEVDMEQFRIRLTIHKTGHVDISFVDKASGEERILKIINPFTLRVRNIC